MATHTHARISTVVRQLMTDEVGFIISTELVLISTITVLGLVAALTCVRDAVVGEMKDVANAVGSLNQSYHYTGMHGCISRKCGLTSATSGSFFSDLQDNDDTTQIEGGNHAVPSVPVERTPAEPQPSLPCPVVEPPPCPQVAPARIYEEWPAPGPGPVLAPCDCETRSAVVMPVCNECGRGQEQVVVGPAPVILRHGVYGSPHSFGSHYDYGSGCGCGQQSLAPRAAVPMFLPIAPGSSVVW